MLSRPTRAAMLLVEGPNINRGRIAEDGDPYGGAGGFFGLWRKD